MALSIFNPREEEGGNLTGISEETQSFLLNERLNGLRYVMKFLLVIALPLIFGFVVFNVVTGKWIEALIAFIMWLWIAAAYYLYRSRSSIESAGYQFRVYENIIRIFLLFFLIYLIYSVGWKGDIDRIQWAYIMPILSFLSLGRRESMVWMLVYIIALSVMFILPGADEVSHSPLYSDFINGFKFRFIFSFSVISAIGFAWNYWIENTYSRLALRQQKLAESESKYREANEILLREMDEKSMARQALAESLEQFKLVINNARDVIWMLNMNLEFTFISPSIEQMLGYTLEEYIKIPHEKIFEPESFNRLFEVFAEELNREKDPGKDHGRSRTIETVQIRRDGVRIWVELKMNFVYDREMNPVGILGYSRDITERKKSEEEKDKLVEQLQHAARLEAIGTLAGGIAHDFNNLLMGIQGYASLLKMKAGDADSAFSMLGKIEEQVKSGANLTAQLLGYARGGRYHVEPLKINGIIEKTISLFGRTRKDITIEVKFQEDIWSIEADRGQMERIFMNLFVNSSEAITGSGLIRVSTENTILNERDVLPYLLPRGRYVKTVVRDNGMGMDEKILARIFEPFYSTKAHGKGTGLGLATVYGIVKGHRGIIEAESEPDQGTLFTIYFPASDKKSVEVRPVEKEISRGAGNILLVDDEPDVLETVSGMVRSMGYTVYTAVNSEEALSVFEKERIDLIILDIILRGETGEDIFVRFRLLDPDVKILLASGYSMEGKAEAIMNLGCNGFIQKPFNMESLSFKIREILA